MNLLFFIILFITYLLNQRKNKIEPFRERLGYRCRRDGIANCPTFYCVMKMENACNNWCSNNLPCGSIEYCKYRCYIMARDRIDALNFQERQFGRIPDKSKLL